MRRATGALPLDPAAFEKAGETFGSPFGGVSLTVIAGSGNFFSKIFFQHFKTDNFTFNLDFLLNMLYNKGTD